MVQVARMVIEIGIFVVLLGLSMTLIVKKSSMGVLVGFIMGFVLREYWSSENLVIFTAIWIVVLCVITGKIEVDAFIEKIRRK